jgi:MoaA/NifB/PqqE/SkfB family radical SAM enzyme
MRRGKFIDGIKASLGIINFRSLDLIPTWRCNAHCLTCNSWKLKSNMLSRKQATQILNSPLFKDLELLIIEGGEVTLWPALKMFVLKYMSLHRGDILILTNGYDSRYWDKTITFWGMLRADIKRLRFVVSLNGIGEVHNKTRGLKDGYRRALETIKIFRDAGCKVTIQYVPFKFNEDQYFPIKELAEEFGCSMIICYPSWSTKFEASKRLDPVDPEKLRMMYHENGKEKNFWERWLRECFLDHAEKKKIMPCLAGRLFAHINPDGLIKACSMRDDGDFGQVFDDYILCSDQALRDVLDTIPKCQYVDGNVCCDYLPIFSYAKMPWKLLAWKIGRL